MCVCQVLSNGSVKFLGYLQANSGELLHSPSVCQVSSNDSVKFLGNLQANSGESLHSPGISLHGCGMQMEILSQHKYIFICYQVIIIHISNMLTKLFKLGRDTSNTNFFRLKSKI